MVHGTHGLQHAHQGGKTSIGSIAVQFCIGGSIVALVSYIVAHASTKVAALVYSLPLTFIPVLVFVWKHAEEQGNPLIVQEYLGQSLAGILLLVLFLAALYWFTCASLAPKDGTCPSTLTTGQFMRNLLIALVFMAVPMAWFYYFVCEKPTGSQACTKSRTCYFG